MHSLSQSLDDTFRTRQSHYCEYQSISQSRRLMHLPVWPDTAASATWYRFLVAGYDTTPVFTSTFHIEWYWSVTVLELTRGRIVNLWCYRTLGSIFLLGVDRHGQPDIIWARPAFRIPGIPHIDVSSLLWAFHGQFKRVLWSVSILSLGCNVVSATPCSWNRTWPEDLVRISSPSCLTRYYHEVNIVGLEDAWSLVSTGS